jgi:hypothetical protein
MKHAQGIAKRGKRIQVRISTGKGPFGSHRRRWEDNIKVDTKKVECEDVDWIQVTRDRVQWLVLLQRKINL